MHADTVQREVGFSALKDYLADGEARRYVIIFSSGTSGKRPKVTVRRHSGTAIYSVPSMNRPLVMTGTLSLRLTNATGFLYYNPSSESVLVLESEDVGEHLDRIFSEYKPDSFFSFPFFLLKVLEHVRLPETLKRFVKGIFVGEGMSAEKRSFLAKKLPNLQFLLHYSSSELGSLSAPCFLLPRNQYHPLSGVGIVVHDADENGIGEIVVTKTLSTSVTVDSYPTGDMGRLLHVSCPCGEPVTFEVLGRKDFDFVKLAGAILRQEEFDRVAAELSDYIADYRVRASERLEKEKNVGVVSIELVPTRQVNDEEAAYLAKEIASRLFVSPRKVLADFIGAGAFLPVEIAFVESFPPQLKPVKLRKE